MAVESVDCVPAFDLACDNVYSSELETDDIAGFDISAGLEVDIESFPIEVNPFSSANFADELFGFMFPSEIRESAPNTADSICGLTGHIIETGSSNISTIPFPFHNQPELPHVDEFILKDKLHYSNLRIQNMQEHNAKTMNPLHHSAKDIVDSEWSKRDTSSTGKSRVRVTTTQTSTTSEDGSNQADTTLSSNQIKQFVEYVLLSREDEKRNGKPHLSSSSTGPTATGIYYQDMVTALRMHVRKTNKFEDRRDSIEDLLMASFDDLLVRSSLTPILWFNGSSQSLIGGENQMTALMFNRSIRSMCEQHGLPLWTNSDLKVLRLYMNLEGECDLNVRGVRGAFRKFHSTDEEREHLEAAQPIISKIKCLMHSKKSRVIDLFHLITKSIEDPVPPKKLIAAIEQLLVTGEDPKIQVNAPVKDATTRSWISYDDSVAMRGGRGKGGEGGPIRPHVLPRIGTTLDSLTVTKDIASRVTNAQEDMQARLHMAANDTARSQKLLLQTSKATPFDFLTLNTISSGIKSCKGKLYLTPLPLSSTALENRNKSEKFSTNIFPLEKFDLNQSKLSFTLSATFPNIVQKRTQSLVSNLQQYDLKRERNLSRLAALY